jgi:nicotinate phosphoribosyltransferase
MTENKTMLTDLYQLTMNASYVDKNMDEPAVFELFIRKLPGDWGYLIANGIEEAVDYLTNLNFTDSDIEFLREKGLFSEEFLDTLRDFRFEGEAYAVREGTPIFPNEPIIRVHAPRTQAQFVETALLNIINYQTLIATKANRIVNAAQGAAIADFGLRRAQGEDAAMKGARAAYIGGASATSNVKAGMEFNIPITGTHAHSFVMSFPSELEAFRAYAKTFPNSPTLLIDTYDTVQGARNAAIVAKELESMGKMLGAVRIDSGDIAELSRRVKDIFAEQGLSYVKVIASNDLNEYKIEEIIQNGGRVDRYGVGTELITAKPTAALPGVYKLVEDSDGPKIKLSEGKRTLPGIKQVHRFSDSEGNYMLDVIALEGEEVGGMILLEKVVDNGIRVRGAPGLSETREYSLGEIAKLPHTLKKTRVQEQYDVTTTPQLQSLVERLSKQYGKRPQLVYNMH